MFQKDRKGFTLIELAIVMVILGLGLVAFVNVLELFLVQQQREELKSTSKSVRLALAEYAQENGRLPCPAPLSAPMDDPAFAVAQATMTGPNVTACDTSYSHANNGTGIFFAAGGPGTDDDVYIGTVPTQALGLGSDLMLDPWAGRFTYAVSHKLVVTGGMPSISTEGAITVLDKSGAALPKLQQFVLFSHGLDGAGAYTADGVKYGKACDTTKFEGENCDWSTGGTINATFADRQRSTNEASNEFYDDYFAFTFGEDDPDGWWRLADNGADIYNLNPGNVGIGTDDPVGKLHVDTGNLGVYFERNGKRFGIDPNNGGWLTQLKSDTGMGMGLYTNAAGGASGGNLGIYVHPNGNVGVGGTTNPTQKLDVAGNIKASGKIMLNAGCPGGQVLRSVSNGDPVCVTPPAPSTNIPGGTCPGGQFMIGINSNGTPKCSGNGSYPGAPCYRGSQAGFTLIYNAWGGKCCMTVDVSWSGNSVFCYPF